MTAFFSRSIGRIFWPTLHMRPREKSEYRAWLKQFAHWLYSTDHIRVRYEIDYDRVDIRKFVTRHARNCSAASLSCA